MEKLREVTREYSNWREINVYIDRIEVNYNADFSTSLENSKALLETICKEICFQENEEVTKSEALNSLVKKTCRALSYNKENVIVQISSALVNNIAYLRNKIGTTSHGKTLAELAERNNKITELEKEFLIASIEIVSCLLINTFEKQRLEEKPEKDLLYIDNNDFNDFWDEEYGEFALGNYSFPASEILFCVDKEAYESEYNEFLRVKEVENDTN